MEPQGPASTPDGQPPQSPPPGWYPDAQGVTRWWDGQQWSVAASQVPATVPTGGMGGDPKSMAVLAEVLGLLTGWIGPLIIYLVNGDKDPFVKHHSSEALNFHLTVLIAYLVSFVLMFVLIGFVLVFVVLVLSFVFSIQAAMAANRGEWYRYPVSIRMVSGAVG